MARPSLGGLMATRQGALLLALLCAICAAGILVFALGRYRSSLQTQTQQATVLVATAEIHKGTSASAIASANLYKSTPVVATQLAPGAMSNAALLTGKVAATDILPGQQLTLADFAGVSGVTGTLTPNQRAISISTDATHGDLAVLAPGNHVDIYTLFTSTTGAGSHAGPTVLLLAANVDVLKTPSGASGTMVLLVNADQVPKIDFAMSQGSLYMALRPPNGTLSPYNPTTLHSVIASSLEGGH
jgi:Flp pilus assembly protein CpaB